MGEPEEGVPFVAFVLFVVIHLGSPIPLQSVVTAEPAGHSP